MDNERALRAEKVREVQAHSVMGTVNYWRNPLFPKFNYTDGVKGVAEAAGAYWLIDAIMSHQAEPKVAAEARQFWKLEYHRLENHWTLRGTDGDKGDGEVILAEQKIEFSDFPLDEFKIWFHYGTMLLPEEY